MNDINDALEAFYYAHSAIIAKPDAILAKRGLCRVHHRILYFIGRNPGLSVNELLSKLKVSKQSLNALMRKLLLMGFISSEADQEDRRIRRLKLTERGAQLENELTLDQRNRLAKAFEATDAAGVAGWYAVMQSLKNT